MPTYVFKGRNRLGEVIVGERIADNREMLRQLLRREQVMLTSVKEKGREIAVPKIGQAEEGQSQRPCHLHTPVLRDDRRRLAARAVPRHPRRSSRRTSISRRCSVQVRQDVEEGATLAQLWRATPKCSTSSSST